MDCSLVPTPTKEEMIAIAINRINALQTQTGMAHQSGPFSSLPPFTDRGQTDACASYRFAFDALLTAWDTGIVPDMVVMDTSWKKEFCANLPVIWRHD